MFFLLIEIALYLVQFKVKMKKQIDGIEIKREIMQIRFHFNAFIFSEYSPNNV